MMANRITALGWIEHSFRNSMIQAAQPRPARRISPHTLRVLQEGLDCTLDEVLDAPDESGQNTARDAARQIVNIVEKRTYAAFSESSVSKDIVHQCVCDRWPFSTRQSWPAGIPTDLNAILRDLCRAEHYTEIASNIEPYFHALLPPGLKWSGIVRVYDRNAYVLTDIHKYALRVYVVTYCQEGDTATKTFPTLHEMIAFCSEHENAKVTAEDALWISDKETIIERVDLTPFLNWEKERHLRLGHKYVPPRIYPLAYSETEEASRKQYAYLKRLRIDADKGDDRAQYSLGVMYLFGGSLPKNVFGGSVPKNSALGLRLLRSAAERGYRVAQCMLGLMYYKGEQVERDFSEAAKWYRLAAEQNDDLAAVRLGLMYTHGEGVAKDLVQAYKWIQIGDCVDKHFVMNWSRVWLEPHMTENEISEALRLIGEFRARARPGRSD